MSFVGLVFLVALWVLFLAVDLIFIAFLIPRIGTAQTESVVNKKTGKKAADKYFLKRNHRRKPSSPLRAPASGGPRYLSLHVGTFVSQDTYKWGNPVKNDVGKWTMGVTYRVGEWVNSMDLLFRADFIAYEVDDKDPLKLSLMPIVTFPDSKSGFPLYFGAGAGLGIFFKQAEEESSLSFDYQLIAGARFLDVLGSTGVFLEIGLKNHIHLLSDGQHNGVFGALGAAFTF